MREEEKGVKGREGKEGEKREGNSEVVKLKEGGTFSNQRPGL